MDSLGCYCCLLALLPLLYLIRKSSYANRSRLRLPPGPWQLPVIGSLHHLRGGLLHRALRDLSRRHGPVMFLRFGEVPVVVASSREAAREVMKTHDAVFATRPQTPTVEILSEGCPGVVFAPCGDEWRQLRKICVVELLSARRVLSFRPVREEEAARLVRSISSAPAPRLVNLGERLAAYMSDASVRTIMGDRFKDRDAFLQELERAVVLLGGFGLADLFPSSRVVRALSPMARMAKAHREAVLKLVDGVLSEHMARRSHGSGAADHEDLIDVLVRIQSQNKFLTNGAIKGLIRDLFAAGSEMAAITLHWAMAELMRNPPVMSKLQDEVRRAFTATTKVTEERLSKLSYLHRVVDETLRLHPPTPLLLPRECQEECRILGYNVPKGAMVMVNVWAISTDPAYWGDEPEMFRPERFEAAGKRDFRGNDFEFTPFGAGRRICPGISFALANIELALASLLFHFDWSLPEGVTCGELDMTEAVGITTRRKSQLWLRATPHHVPQPH